MITWISIKLGSQSCIWMVHSFCAGEKSNKILWTVSFLWKAKEGSYSHLEMKCNRVITPSSCNVVCFPPILHTTSTIMPPPTPPPEKWRTKSVSRQSLLLYFLSFWHCFCRVQLLCPEIQQIEMTSANPGSVHVYLSPLSTSLNVEWLLRVSSRALMAGRQTDRQHMNME